MSPATQHGAGSPKRGHHRPEHRRLSNKAQTYHRDPVTSFPASSLHSTGGGDQIEKIVSATVMLRRN
jgi:hypothetical protein